jgi:hypothetical protein
MARLLELIIQGVRAISLELSLINLQMNLMINPVAKGGFHDIIK